MSYLLKELRAAETEELVARHDDAAISPDGEVTVWPVATVPNERTLVDEMLGAEHFYGLPQRRPAAAGRRSRRANPLR